MILDSFTSFFLHFNNKIFPRHFFDFYFTVILDREYSQPNILQQPYVTPRMMDFGLIQKYFKDEMDKVGIIKDEKKTAKSAKALSLHHLEGAFTIYCILNGISIVIFICEYLIGRRQKRFQQETINLGKITHTQDAVTITRIFERRRNSRLLVKFPRFPGKSLPIPGSSPISGNLKNQGI